MYIRLMGCYIQSRKRVKTLHVSLLLFYVLWIVGLSLLSCPVAPAKSDDPLPVVTGTVTYFDIATMEGVPMTSLPPVLDGEILDYTVQYSIKRQDDSGDIIPPLEGVAINFSTGIIELSANTPVTTRPLLHIVTVQVVDSERVTGSLQSEVYIEVVDVPKDLQGTMSYNNNDVIQVREGNAFTIDPVWDKEVPEVQMSNVVYSITPEADGIHIDPRTGVLSFNNDTVEQALTTYTVVVRGIGAYIKEPAQELSFEVEIEIYSKNVMIDLDGLLLTYQDIAIAFVNQKIESFPQWNIGVTDFDVRFSVEVKSGEENGMSIDPSTGVLTIVPVYAITSPAVYTITAESTNEYYTGSATAELSIQFVDDNGCEINSWEESDDGFYKIFTARQLALIETKGLDLSYRVMKDIEMPLNKSNCFTQLDDTTNTVMVNDVQTTIYLNNFDPIGDDQNPFTGTFDGGKHTINGLRISRSDENYVGLFGYMRNASLMDIQVDTIRIEGNEYVGAIVGKTENSTITNVRIQRSFDNEVIGVNNYVGGLAGYVEGGSLSGVTHGNVTGGYYVGGLVGYMDSTDTIMGYSSSSVTGRVNGWYVGGLIGYIENGVLRGYSSGKIKGGQYVGGLVGYVLSGDATTSVNGYAIGEVFGNNYVGGLAGESNNKQVYGFSRAKIMRNEAWKPATYEFGLLLGSGQGQGYYSLIDSELLGINIYITTGKHGYKQAMNASTTQSDFDVLNFQNNVWIWVADGQWPAINIDSLESVTTQPVGRGDGEVFDYGCEESTNQPPQNDEGVFLISLPQHLLWISNCIENTYELVNDIDLSGFSAMKPIGLNTDPFRGIFRGNGYTIRNLDLNNKSNNFVGLFGYISDATIENLNVEYKNLIGRSYVGGLVGYAENDSTIVNVNVTAISADGVITGSNNYVGGIVGRLIGGSVQGNIAGDVEKQINGADYVGGLVGYAINAVVEGDVGGVNTSTINITGKRYVGTLAGYSMNSTITGNANISVVINGTSRLGGLAGYMHSGSITGNVVKSLTITGDEYIGGLSGEAKESTIKGDVGQLQELLNMSGTSHHVGGLAGYVEGGSIEGKVRGTITVSGTHYVGGLVGEASGNNIAANFDGTPTIRGTKYVGGLIGSLLANSRLRGYFLSTNGDITGAEYTGGLVGNINESNIDANTNGILRIQGTDYTGGLVGHVVQSTVSGNAIGNVTITGAQYTGGLVGKLEDQSTLIGDTRGSNSIGITGTDYTGGLAGHVVQSTVSGNATDNVTITGAQYTGGLVGKLEDQSTLIGDTRGSNSIGITGTDYTGGLAGHVVQSTVRGNTTGNVTVTGAQYAGGLVGKLEDQSSSTGNTTSTTVITVTGTQYTGGLVGNAANSTVNGNVTNVTVKGESYTGGLVGELGGRVPTGNTLDGNATGTISVTGDDYTGGLVGSAHDVVMRGDISNAVINGKNNTGGILGVGTLCTVTGNATTSLQVTGLKNTGGAMGLSSTCTVTLGVDGVATINGSQLVGGLIGEATTSTITGQVISRGGTVNVTGKNQTGGLVGKSYQSSVSGYTQGTMVVRGEDYVGGLVGFASADGKAIRGYSTSTINGNNFLGGLVGGGKAIVTGYFTGSISGKTNIGGLVGSLQNSTVHGYATGTLSGESNIGGLVGNGELTNDVSGYFRGQIDIATGFESIDTVGLLAGKVAEEDDYTGYRLSSSQFNITDFTRVTGVQGVPVTMNANVTQAAFDRLNFANNTWVWVNNGMWPAINIAAIQNANAQPIQSSANETVDTCTTVVADRPVLAGGVYQISSVSEFRWIANCLDGNFIMTRDLDFTNQNAFVPIGNKVYPFTGILDGNEFTISNIAITGTSYMGLFGYTFNATIQDLTIDHAGITGENYVGSLAGYAIDNTITNVSMRSTDGFLVFGSKDYVGGLVGRLDNSTLHGRTLGAVQGSGVHTGGLVGLAENNSTIIGYVEATVTGNESTTAEDNVGGLVGTLKNSSVNGYSTGNVSGTGAANKNIGGLVGLSDNSTIVGYMTGDVTGSNNVGGVVGRMVNNGRITGYMVGNVSGVDYVGVLIGVFAGTGSSGYARGVVTRVSGNSTNFGYVAGVRSNFNLISYRSALVVQPIFLTDARGENGTARDITVINNTNYNTSSGFGNLTFGNNVGAWSWVVSNQWPAVNLEDMDAIFSTTVNGDDADEQPTQE